MTWSSRSPVFMGLCSVMLGVPLAVLGSATGPYDDPKAWALPILVAGTGLAWVIRHREALGRRPESAPDRKSGWVRFIVTVYGLWWVVTTLASLGLGQSLFGNFGRGLGLVTFGSAILLFPLVRSECRSPRAVRGLIDAALLGSAPVCLLAFGQALGWDPLPKAWDPAVARLTVRSTFGQHIFLGSYLVALVPLTVARLDWGLRDRGPSGPRGDPGPGPPWRCVAVTAVWTAGAVGLVALAPGWNPAWWLLVPWGVIGAVGWGLALAPRGATLSLPPALVALLLASQVLVVLLCQARGAFFGMLAGLSVTAIGLFVRRRAWLVTLSTAGGLVAVTVFLVLLNLPGSPLAPLRSVPLLSRLSHLADDVQTGTPGWFRLEVWWGTLDGWRRQLAGEVFIPGLSPHVRSLVGYGLETQLVTLDGLALSRVGGLRANVEGGRAEYVVDRAHNIILDHLVTGGLVGVGLWAFLIGGVLASGVARARAATTHGERAVRIGALGGLVAYLVEEQVGILTPMPLALFWVAASLCTLPSWSERSVRFEARPRRAPWVVAVITTMLLAGLVAWFETRWLLASVAYAEGSRSRMAGRTLEAYQRFQHSRVLAPWLVLPAEAAAYSGLRLAAAETQADRRLAWLREADAALAAVGPHGGGGASHWTLRAQIAFAQVRAGERDKLEASLYAFEHAARLRPRDWQLMTQWAWALVEAGDPARARATVRQALAEPQGSTSWLAWAVLARAAKDLGDETEAERAAVSARLLAEPESSRILESLGLLPR